MRLYGIRPRLRPLSIGVAAAVVAGTVAVTATSATATATTTVTLTTSPAKAAAGWLARQLVGPNHDHYAVSFNGQSFPDAGETIDGLLGMDAAGVAQTAAHRVTLWLAANAKSYATGSGFTPSTYYPGALAKLLLAAEAQHANVHDFGGIDLVKALKNEEQSNGVFQNTGDTSFGSSPIDQALALIALSHTGSYFDWPDARAIAWLVGQQCGDGGFVSSNQNTPAKTCTDVDASAYVAQALLTVHSSAAARALRWVFTHHNSDGGYGLTSNGKASSNANSTALAVQAIRQAGFNATAPLAWLIRHQVGCKLTTARHGAITFAGTYTQPTALRATTQAAQALAHRWLGDITNNGAIAAAPYLAC